MQTTRVTTGRTGRSPGTRHKELPYLGWGVRARVLPLIQLVPALHQLDDHGVAEVDQLEACDVGAAVHEALQVDVFKTLQGQRERERERGVMG